MHMGSWGLNELSQSYGNIPKQKGDDQISHHEPSLSNGKKHHKDIFFHLLDQAYGMSMMLGDECTGIGWDSLVEAYGFMGLWILGMMRFDKIFMS